VSVSASDERFFVQTSIRIGDLHVEKVISALTPEQETYATYLALAGWAGCPILVTQVSLEAFKTHAFLSTLIQADPFPSFGICRAKLAVVVDDIHSTDLTILNLSWPSNNTTSYDEPRNFIKEEHTAVHSILEIASIDRLLMVLRPGSISRTMMKSPARGLQECVTFNV
jgi:hypothetical protein